MLIKPFELKELYTGVGIIRLNVGIMAIKSSNNII
jgi:hypothetical protein